MGHYNWIIIVVAIVETRSHVALGGLKVFI